MAHTVHYYWSLVAPKTCTSRYKVRSEKAKRPCSAVALGAVSNSLILSSRAQ
jgi:hypothetical protein